MLQPLISSFFARVVDRRAMFTALLIFGMSPLPLALVPSSAPDDNSGARSVALGRHPAMPKSGTEAQGDYPFAHRAPSMIRSAFVGPFEINQGQFANQVRFVARTGRTRVSITDDGITYSVFTHPVAVDAPLRGISLREVFSVSTPFRPRGTRRSPAVANYFVGDRKRWRSDIPTYEEVTLEQVWPRIDLVLRAERGALEKVFVVKPGADPSAIHVGIEGAETIDLDQSGALRLATAAGVIVFSQPRAFQLHDGVTTPVQVSYSLVGSQYGFSLGDYEEQSVLIIDPLFAATLIGGSGVEAAYTVRADTEGNVFVSGITTSVNYPVTPGAFDATRSISPFDGFISKFDPTFTTLLASTYLGGNGLTNIYDLTIDTSGNVVVAGNTHAIDFPTTVGAYQATAPGGQNGFVSKLDNTLTRLVASTYLGGPGSPSGTFEGVLALSIDSSGRIYAVGETSETGFPTTVGAFDRTHSGGVFDGFASRLSADLRFLTASTFLGGSSDEHLSAVSLDGFGNLFITGFTFSPDFPTVSGVFDTVINGNNGDAFVSRLNADLTATNFRSTFLGGTGPSTGDGDMATDLFIDGSNRVYVVGWTNSPDFPTTVGALDRTFNGTTDIFVTRFDNDLSGTNMRSSFIGGQGLDRGFGVAVDASGNVFVAGDTDSNDYPTTTGAFDRTRGGTFDAVVSRLNADLSLAGFASTLIGGSGDDFASRIVLHPAGGVIVVGSTDSADFPTNADAYNRCGNGDFDVAVWRLASDLAPPVNTPSGADILVSPHCALSMTFSQVTQAGVTTSSSTTTNPGPGAAEFEFLGTYYDISTSASYSGPVEICITYDDTGMTFMEEASLRLFHLEAGTWVDVTSSLDTRDNVICGTVSSLSFFAAAVRRCFDADRDGFGSPGDSSCTGGGATDCDDMNAQVYPGAPQLCDGINNDCSDPVWPAVPTNEADTDGDGYRICAGDCLDKNPAVYPAAPQICDGVNNDCSAPGWPTLNGTNEFDDDGDSFTECGGDCTDANSAVWGTPGEVVGLTLAGTTLSWSAPINSGGTPASVVYDTIRTTNKRDFVTTPPATCVETDDGSNTTATDPAIPSVGTTFYYLVRAQNSCPGTVGIGPLGTTSGGTARSARDCP